MRSARHLFAVHGYSAVSIDQIVTDAEITRGALYHHFEDKRDLFRAVFHAVEDEVSARVPPEPPPEDADDPWKRYRLRLQSFLDAILKVEFHQILLIDGPAVLGWAEWRELESHYGIGAIGRALQTAMTAGSMRQQPVEPLAHILLGAINEVTLLIVNSPDRKQVRKDAGAALDSFLAGLALV